MLQLLLFIVLISPGLSYEITKLSETDHELILQISFEEPSERVFQSDGFHIKLPYWQGTHYSYNAKSDRILPYISFPIILPPSGAMPEITIRDISYEPAEHPLPEGPPEDLQLFAPDLDFTDASPLEFRAFGQIRQYKTGTFFIFPYHQPGQRITRLQLSAKFPQNMDIVTRPLQKDEFIPPVINRDQARNWQVPRPVSLHRISGLPSGSWYKILISKHGVYRITPDIFGADIPDSDPKTWHLYSPFYLGSILPLGIESGASIPENLREIAFAGTGLEDGQFTGDDQILFFARGINGDFNGNHFIHPYSTQSYYWLNVPDFSGTPGLGIDTLTSGSGDPDTTISSYQTSYYHENELVNLLHSGNVWLGEKMNGNSDQMTLSFSADHVVKDEIEFSAKFQGSLETLTGIINSVAISVNGTSLNTTQSGNGNVNPIYVKGVAGGDLLKEGSNTIRIDYTSNSYNSVLYLDTLRMSYYRQLAPDDDILLASLDLEEALNELMFTDLSPDYRIWDITDPAMTTELLLENNAFQMAGPGKHTLLGFSEADIRNATLIEASDLGQPALRRTDIRADYVIITPDAFYTEAERIKDIRENLVSEDERMDVFIAPLETIYDEFSAGTSDLGAIKYFLHYAYHNWQGDPLLYVLLLGDGDYDFRNITGQSTTRIPIWQEDGLNDISSYSSDDHYTYLSGGIADESPDIAIGRFPAETLTDLRIMVDKLEAYLLSPETGLWRNTVTLVGDDPMRPYAYETTHIYDSEKIADNLPNSVLINKVYLTEYAEVQDPNSPYIKKPDARDDFLQKIYNGTVLINFLGHGSPRVWTQEEVFTYNDLGQVKTGLKLPFWVAGTCDWGKIDDINSNCVPEELLLMPGNGAVGILSSTRKSFASYNFDLLEPFFQQLFTKSSSGLIQTVGEAVMISKGIHTTVTANDEKFILLSDPALRLAVPKGSGRIDSIQPDELKAMGNVQYAGTADRLLQDGGMATVTAWDTPTQVTREYYWPDDQPPKTITYILPGDRIFRGLISVTGDAFTGQFIIPKDIKYSGTGGMLNVQYWDDSGWDGMAYVDTLYFLGSDSAEIDDNGPEIIFLNQNIAMMNGDHFSANDKLVIELSDPQGINLTGVAGHGITLAIDNDWSNAMDITELFEYELDRSDLGQVNVYLSQISPGEHSIGVKAWDSQNNPSTAEIRLEFFAADDFTIFDLFNYPNPMIDQTEFTFMLSHPADITLDIYTLSGRNIYSNPVGLRNQGFNTFPWDGRDDFGNTLANGVYIYVITGENSELEETVQVLQKLVITH